MELQPEGVGRRQHLTRIDFGHSEIGWIDQQGHDKRTAGSASCSNSSAFGATSTFNWVTPVTLPPGRLRLATRPSRTGSEAISKTIGMVVVAAFAASAA